MAGNIMSRCPFWSTNRERVECYKECPLLTNESHGKKDSSHCIFNDCTEANNLHFKDIVNEDYNFLNLSAYNEETSIMNY